MRSAAISTPEKVPECKETRENMISERDEASFADISERLYNISIYEAMATFHGSSPTLWRNAARRS